MAMMILNDYDGNDSHDVLVDSDHCVCVSNDRKGLHSDNDHT